MDYSVYRQKSSPQEIQLGHFIANYYNQGHVNGWAGEAIAREQFYLLASKPQQKFFVSFPKLTTQAGGKMFLYQCVRKALGTDTKNYPQQIGDCVSFGAKNAIEYLICVQKTLGVAHDIFRPVFPPYLYGCGRVLVGKGQIPASEDGSVGAWQAEAVGLYGGIAADEQGVPPYSGSVAKKWGGGNGPPSELVTIGKQHLVKSAAPVKSYEDVVTAITNGYTVTVASNQGFQMEAGSDGFHSPSGSWGHQMCIMGADSTYKTPYALILNSWGDVHGHLKDFDTGEDLPVGVLRVRAETISKMVGQGDSFAYSHLEWFEEQKLDEALFKLI